MITAYDYAARGYRVISRRYRIVARIDRPDWIDVLRDQLKNPRLKENDQGMCWEDHFRRCCSEDKIILPRDVSIEEIPNSGWNYCGFVER